MLATEATTSASAASQRAALSAQSGGAATKISGARSMKNESTRSPADAGDAGEGSGGVGAERLSFSDGEVKVSKGDKGQKGENWQEIGIGKKFCYQYQIKGYPEARVSTQLCTAPAIEQFPIATNLERMKFDKKTPS